MPLVSRLGDMGIGVDTCCQNSPTLTGIIISSSPSVASNNISVARTTDLVLSTCGNIGIIVTGCFDVASNGLAITGIGDIFSGCFNGTIITGSSNVECS